MNKVLPIGFLWFLSLVSCTKETTSPQSDNMDCGVTGFYGPVRYYLVPAHHAFFVSYKTFHQLDFVDSATGRTTSVSYNSDAMVSDDTLAMVQHQGDTLDFGETASLTYNYGSNDIGHVEYHFRAYPDHQDSVSILLTGCPQDLVPAHVFFWTLNLSATNATNVAGYTPYIRLDSISLMSHTFHEVFVLQRGNALSPGDSSNTCYYTKTNGIIAFTDKRYNRFWIRTNF